MHYNTLNEQTAHDLGRAIALIENLIRYGEFPGSSGAFARIMAVEFLTERNIPVHAQTDSSSLK